MLLPLILQLYFKNIFISSLKKQQQKTTHVCILHKQVTCMMILDRLYKHIFFMLNNVVSTISQQKLIQTMPNIKLL